MYCVYGIAVGTSTVVRYSEEVRYWEGPLSEVLLYSIPPAFPHLVQYYYIHMAMAMKVKQNV